MSDNLGEERLERSSRGAGRGGRRFFEHPDGTRLGRIRGRLGRRQPSAQTMLPLLIKVFAGFSKLDGTLVEDDIDSSLGFLRHDYPEALYSELRELYQRALGQTQDLNETAQELADQLTIEDKILLGVQLYVLISRAQFRKQQLLAFYLFMTNLGVASEAIDIVYQLNTSDFEHGPAEKEGEQPLESLFISNRKPADVVFTALPEGFAAGAFRFQKLVLIKNVGTEPIIARGRQVEPGEFCRLFEGQRLLLVDVVLDYQDLIFYFNAKKNVSSTKLYLAFSSTGSPYLEKSPTRDSHLEILFGLDARVRALRDTDARLNGRPLRAGAEVEVSLSDRITFKDHTEVAISELRRRAREMGGSFELTPSRTEYFVSNDPDKLREGDILLSQGSAGKLLLKIRCNYEARSGELEVLESDRPLLLRGNLVRDSAPLADGDTIQVGEGQYLRCDFTDRIIEEERNIISQLEIRDATHWYDQKSTALEAISLEARRGELICVMGPSGCGKSTLLRCLAGHLQPRRGKILLNGFSLYENTASLKPFISYIPHEDAFDSLLSVRENITTAASVRAPQLSRAERSQRVDTKLVELGLYQLRNRLAGTPEDKFLSSGERKRLNVGLDMIAISDVYLFDEPTSGLSSKDSEHVIEIIRGMAHNKIIFVSIHQPSTRLFRMFHRALLLDKEGKMAFFGTPDEMLEYFHDAYMEEVGRRPKAAVGAAAPPEDAPDAAQGSAASRLQPDFIFDVLETPLRDLGGDIIYEADSRGHYAPARRFSPDFWRDRYQAHRIVKEARASASAAGTVTATAAGETATGPQVISAPRKLPNPPVRRLKEELVQFAALARRAFLSKLRNRANLVTTLLEAPLLAVLVATVLRYSEEGEYTFAAAFHIPAYLFLSLVVAMFLGLTNSADEIIRDRALLQRERNQNVRITYYIASKFTALSFFALLQCVIYILIGNAILEVRGMFATYLWWMFITSMNGVALGLLISSFVKDSKTAINWIPIVLIPQIILGGALIKYEEMNRNLDFVFSIRRWLEPDEATGEVQPPSRLKVPFICEFMPLRWSYESIVIAQANHNPIADTQHVLDRRIKELVDQPELDEAAEDELDRAKEALAIVSSLEAETAGKLARTLDDLRRRLREGTFDPEDFEPADLEDPVTGDEIYLNQKVLDLVTKAEMERLDYRDRRAQNVFFGTEKVVTFWRSSSGPLQVLVPTLVLNGMVLAVFTMISLVVLCLCLRRTLTRVA